jgi:hypothetical protein
MPATSAGMTSQRLRSLVYTSASCPMARGPARAQVLRYGSDFNANGGSTKAGSEKSNSKAGSKIPPSAREEVAEGRSNPANDSADKILPSARKDVGNIQGRGFVCKHKHSSCLRKRKSTTIQAAAVGSLRRPPSVSRKSIARHRTRRLRETGPRRRPTSQTEPTVDLSRTASRRATPTILLAVPPLPRDPG